MAKKRFKALRATGDWGGHLADLLTLLGTNWALVVSAIIAIATGGLGTLRAFALTPSVYVGAAVFLALLWTLIGILVLIDRRKPRQIQVHADYRYGLTFEGFLPSFTPENFPMLSQRGILGFSINLRNWSSGPIKYTLESADIQIGTRTVPRSARNPVSGYISRGGAKTVRPAAFSSGTLNEYYGKGETKGTAEIAIIYGPPDGPPVRRFRINIDLTLFFPEEGRVDPLAGIGLGYADNITFEGDEPI